MRDQDNAVTPQNIGKTILNDLIMVGLSLVSIFLLVFEVVADLRRLSMISCKAV
jgi:hypothetical protein